MSAGPRVRDDGREGLDAEELEGRGDDMSREPENAFGGFSMLRAAKGGLDELMSILQRMRTLALSSASDAMTGEDRLAAQSEIDRLKREISLVASTVQFNGKKLLDGSAAVLWSSNRIGMSALVRGGVWKITAEELSSPREGNFDIRITNVKPGRGAVKGSDIFTVGVPDVLTGVKLYSGNGFDAVSVNGTPPGSYGITTDLGGAAALTFSVRSSHVRNSAAFLNPVVLPSVYAPNLSVLLEVIGVDTTAGSENVKFRASAKGVGADGAEISFSDNNFVIRLDGGLKKTTYTAPGFADVFASDSVAIDTGNFADFTVGDKFVLGVVANADVEATVESTLDQDWDGAWGPAPRTFSFTYGLDSASVSGGVVRLFGHYLDETSGTVYEGDVVVSFNSNLLIGASAGGAIGASFDAAFPGKIAKGEMRLRDIAEFWDANGKFLLDVPRTLTMTQGDGARASVTLYGDDTLESVREKLNDAVARGLGQAGYLSSQAAADKFVTFVENEQYGTQEPMPATFVIRSIIPGESGAIGLAGTEGIVNAFNLRVVRGQEESVFSVYAYDIHGGEPVISGEMTKGNILRGAIDENVDIRFDRMAAIETGWNSSIRGFSWSSASESYRAILHLSGSMAQLQFGDDEGESLSVGIGDMSPDALGLGGVIVTDRESASRAVSMITDAMARVARQRARLGSYNERLTQTMSYLATASMDAGVVNHGRGADRTRNTMEYIKLRIVSQVGSTLFAQVNRLPKNAISFLV